MRLAELTAQLNHNSRSLPITLLNPAQLPTKMSRLDRIKHRMIKDSFPELIGVKGSVRYQRLAPDSWFTCDYFHHEEYFVRVDVALKSAPEGVIVGGLAHEFAHVLRDLNRGILLYWIDVGFYDLSSSYRYHEERATDMLAIQRGYVRELLVLARWEKNSKSKVSGNGKQIEQCGVLLTDELEKIIRESEGSKKAF